MAKMYLLGSSVESEVDRQRSRLLGINNETYIYYCNQQGNSYYPVCETRYCFPLIQKSEPILDENDESVLDLEGNPTFNWIDEFALEIDTDMPEYASLPTIHINRLVDEETMLNNGWFKERLTID